MALIRTDFLIFLLSGTFYTQTLAAISQADSDSKTNKQTRLTKHTMKHKLIFSLLLIFLSLNIICEAQGYEEILTKVEKFLSSKYNEKTPGCAIGIIKDGRLIYKKGFGMANMDYGIPWSSESVINIMSVSKQFTAACIALLILDNKISLQDNIRKYIPEFPDYGHDITIGHLIRHTSGIRDYAELVTLGGGTAENIAYRSDALELVLQQKELNFTPGDRYSYSNSGYLLLTYIIERVSNMSFPDFAKNKIFEPLNMNQSFFSDDPHLIVKNRVTSYGINRNGNYFRHNLNDNRMGCAGLFSTVEDLYKWDQNFYHGNVGGQSFNRLMLSLENLNDGSENDYAFGNIIDRHEGIKEVFHSGGLLGIRSKLSRFPTENLSIIYLGNGSQNQNQDVYPIASLFLKGKDLPAVVSGNNSFVPPANAINPAPGELTAYTGLYFLEDRKVTVQISLSNTGTLKYEIIEWNSQATLYPLSTSDFLLENGGTIKFDLRNKNRFDLVQPGGNQILAKRIPTITGQEINKYAGRYVSEEVRGYFDIKNSSQELILKCGEIVVKTFVPEETKVIKFNEPNLGLVTLEFKENEKEEIDSFLITTERTNKLQFKKVKITTSKQ